MTESDPYADNIVKRFRYWTVYANVNQGYLGRCIVWCNREDALDLTEATPEEWEELSSVLLQVKMAIEKAFQADWMNYSFLGNETRHLHGHVVPRYTSERTFEGVVFRDERWGKNWQVDHSIVTPPELLQAVKRKLQENI